MKLDYQEELNRIDDCPAENDSGNVKLYRVVEKEMTNKSFWPVATLKPKYKNTCKAWGISCFTKKNRAKKALKGLSRNKQVKYRKIAEGVVKDGHGIKNSDKINLHYTFFPKKDIDLNSIFEICKDNE